jgi:hypothetical protein
MKVLRASLALLFMLATAPGGPGRAQAPTSAPTVHQRALLIGVSKYARGVNPQQEWWDLSSGADITAIRALLLEKFTFKDTDIATLSTRQETTRASILAAFEKLIADTRKGDVVYIHYSGHGTQVPDLDGDEFDGLDESIVPSDYVSRKDGSRNIIDDEIGALLAKLAAREPASVLLTFDSCFSGSQTRGGRMIVRGGRYLGPPPPRRPGDDSDVTGLAGREAFAHGYVVISAARNDQVAAETDDGSGGSMGLLTYALVQQMREAGPGTTYRDLFDGILDTMTRRNPGQVPQLEGDLDTVLMNGTVSPPQPYFDTRIEEGRVILQAGSLQGMTAGSVFALYARGTRTFDKSGILAHATVARVQAATAVLTPVESIDVERLRTSRAVETAHKFGETALRVDITDLDRIPGGEELRARMQRAATERGAIRPTRGEAWDLKVCGMPCPEEVDPPGPSRGATSAAMLIRHDGSLAATLPESPDLPGALMRALEAETRWRMVAALERRDPRVQVDVRVVPVDVTVDASGAVSGATRKPAPKRGAGGQAILALGDYFMVEVRNSGSLDAYVTVLDLSPDGTINPIWPHPRLGAQVQENKIHAAVDPQKAAWALIPYPYVFRIGPPAGNEIIKAIATDVPADFAALLTPARSAGIGRGEEAAQKTPVGRLLASVTRGTRGPSLATEPPDPTFWSTGSFTFVIPPAPGAPQ